ncbi:MAG: hypothetical protein GX053_10635 [Tissierella sp.]|nr:hypothetical protein [Tissierella sp.]
MKDNKFLIVTILILSISIFTGSILIANSIRDTNEKANSNQHRDSIINNKGLITESEASEYLSLTHDSFKDLVSNMELQRAKESSYPTYTFIPFIQIDGIKYFSTKQLDEWVEQNSNQWVDIKTFKVK